ncbi:MAG: hypothetical protein ACK5M8_21460, partial [Shewanella algae]
DNAPTGLHAVVPADPHKGLPPGVIFTLRNRALSHEVQSHKAPHKEAGTNTAIHLAQHNLLHPFYLVYIGQNGEIIHDHTEVKCLLDLARTACKGQALPLPEACQLFNQQTADGRKMQNYSELLSQAIRSMIEVKEDKDIDSLFTPGKTTALLDTISGLDDFELIAFLVVQEREQETA